jgi:hypothetical protein
MNDPALHVVKIQQLGAELRELTANAAKPDSARLAMIQTVSREIAEHSQKVFSWALETK